MFKRLASLALALAVLGLTNVAAQPTFTTGTVDLKNGVTAVVFNQVFVSLVGENSVRKITPGHVNFLGLYAFPVSGGAVDLATKKGEINHGGGFAVEAGAVKVSLTDFTISLPASTDGTEGTLSALVTVNGSFAGRVALFAVDLTNGTCSIAKGKKLVLANAGLSLTSDGAAALNAAFNTAVFAADAPVGALTVQAFFAEAAL
jgi:Htaa